MSTGSLRSGSDKFPKLNRVPPSYEHTLQRRWLETSALSEAKAGKKGDRNHHDTEGTSTVNLTLTFQSFLEWLKSRTLSNRKSSLRPPQTNHLVNQFRETVYRQLTANAPLFIDLLRKIFESPKAIEQLTSDDLALGLKYLSHRGRLSTPDFTILCDIVKLKGLEPSILEYNMYLQMYGPFNFTEILDFLRAMESVDKVVPDESTFLVVMRKLAFNADSAGVLKLKDIMVERGLKVDWRHHHAVILALVAENKGKEAYGYLTTINNALAVEDVDPRMRYRPVDMVNTVLSGLIDGKNHKAVVQLMNEMMTVMDGLQCDRYTWHISIKAALSVGDLPMAESILSTMEEIGIRPDAIFYSLFINYHLKKSDFLQANTWLQRMKSERIDPSIVTINDLIHKSAKAQLLRHALKYSQGIVDYNLRPNKATYHILITACVNAGDTDGALQYFREMQLSKIKVTPFVYSQMIRGFCNKRDLQSALKYLTWMEASGLEPTDIIYNSIIRAYLTLGDLATAREWIGKYLDSPIPVKKLPLHMHLRLVKYLLSQDDPETAITYTLRIHSDFLASTLQNGAPRNPSAQIFKPIFKYCLRTRSIALLERLLTVMKDAGHTPPAVAYRCLLALLGQQTPASPETVEIALAVYKEMLNSGYTPNIFVFNQLLKLNHLDPEKFGEVVQELGKFGETVQADSFTYEYLILHSVRVRKDLGYAWGLWKEYLEIVEGGWVEPKGWGKTGKFDKVRVDMVRMMLSSCIFLRAEEKAREVLEVAERHGLDVLEGVPTSFVERFGGNIRSLRETGKLLVHHL
ncbi:hypothetical protein HDV05_007902 [Chytridiales sp. JEL 0842]|nr:hypothetical protein HDV05_007902 [Chytridiales sp. JEL 0842]